MNSTPGESDESVDVGEISDVSSDIHRPESVGATRGSLERDDTAESSGLGEEEDSGRPRRPRTPSPFGSDIESLPPQNDDGGRQSFRRDRTPSPAESSSAVDDTPSRHVGRAISTSQP